MILLSFIKDKVRSTEGGEMLQKTNQKVGNFPETTINEAINPNAHKMAFQRLILSLVKCQAAATLQKGMHFLGLRDHQ